MHMFFDKALPKYFETFYPEFKFSYTHNTRSSSQRLMLPYRSTKKSYNSLQVFPSKSKSIAVRVFNVDFVLDEFPT